MDTALMTVQQHIKRSIITLRIKGRPVLRRSSILKSSLLLCFIVSLSNVYAIGNEVLNVRQFCFRKQKNKSILNRQIFLLFFIQNVPCLYVLCTNRGHLVTNYIFRTYTPKLKQPALFLSLMRLDRSLTTTPYPATLQTY